MAAAKGKKRSKKQPKNLEVPEFKKQPRIPTDASSYLKAPPSWQLSIIDFDGNWGWNNIDYFLLTTEIIPKLQNFETMQWSQILGSKHHEVNIEGFSKEALKRLEELRMDDQETMVSLRLSGEKRLWGVRKGSVLKIIWWDPHHKVYPSKLKHT